MEKSTLIHEIQNQYLRYFKILAPYDELINKSKEIKLTLLYSNTLMCYGEEIAIISDKDWYTGLESQVRCFLECYAILIELISYLPQNEKFTSYVKYLALKDIRQNLSILKATKSDRSITPEIKEHEISVQKSNIEFLIKDLLHEYKDIITLKNFKEAIEIVDNLIESKFSQFEKHIGIKIGTALKYNKIWENSSGQKFQGSYSFYSKLCRTTHNNYSSILQRNILNGYIMMNVGTDSINYFLNLVRVCMEEVNNLIVEVLEEKIQSFV